MIGALPIDGVTRFSATLNRYVPATGAVNTPVEELYALAVSNHSVPNTSVEKVEAGNTLVNNAGRTMGEVVEQVGRVAALINELTVAASEQSDGIGQINTAVGHLDQATQQNAALVEEMASAADSLRTQAERLTGSVARFRIDNRLGYDADLSLAESMPSPRLPARGVLPQLSH